MLGRLVVLTGMALALVPFGDAANVRSTVVFTVTSDADEVDEAPGNGVCRSSRGRCTLRAALNEASLLPSEGTTIQITVPAGTYDLTIDPPADFLRDEQGGDLDVRPRTDHGPLRIDGAGAGRTVIRQRRADGVLEVSWLDAVTITNMTLRGGHALQGGGINNEVVGGLTLRAVEVTSNTADSGGGIASGRPLTVEGSVISDNDAVAGGGIWLSHAEGTITGSTISGNTGTAHAGGIWLQNVDGHVDITQSLIADNTAAPGSGGVPAYGGGIMIFTDSPLVRATTVRVAYTTVRNNIAGIGGGIWFGAPGALTLEGSLVTENTATGAGGIAAGGPVTILNSTVSGNGAEFGGAIAGGSGGDLVLRAATIAGNTAVHGSGIEFGLPHRPFATVTGTILANDPASENCSIQEDHFRADEFLTSPGTNIESGDGCHLTGSDRSSTDPRLGDLASNGGPTQTRALLPGSPAIDHFTAGGCPPLDQRGFSRPAGAGCDIGAFELGATFSLGPAPPIPARRDVTGGRMTITPVGRFLATSLHTGDFRPCAPGKALKGSVAGGFYEPRDGQLTERGSLFFRRGQRVVRFGNFEMLFDAGHGRILATIAPGKGALPLFDVVLLRYAPNRISGHLRLTREAANVLNRLLRMTAFHKGLSCGALSILVGVAPAQGGPTPVTPPPPPPPTTTTTTTTTTTQQTFTLGAAVDPGNGGSIVSDPAGISCPSDCAETYAAGTSVKVKAKPADGFEFKEWDGSCGGSDDTCTVTLDRDRSVTARFKQKQSSKPQCSDGKDNDGDNAIDLQDPQCQGPNDDDEAK